MANIFKPLSFLAPGPRPAAEYKVKDFSELEKLYRIYGKYAFGLAKPGSPDDRIAEEIVHEAFLKYWNNSEKGHHSSVSFFGWLLREVQKNCKERISEFKSVTEQTANHLPVEPV